MAHSNKPDVAHELGNHTSSNYPGKPRLHFDDDGPRLRQGMARRGLEAFGSSSQAEVPTFRFSGVAYAKLTPDHESAAGSSPVVAISHWLLLLLSPLLSAISRRMARAWHA